MTDVWDTYDTRERGGPTQDCPPRRRLSPAVLRVAGAVAFLVAFVVGMSALAVHIRNANREWDAWCVLQGGHIETDWRKVPNPGKPIRYAYCLNGSQVIGARG